MVTTSQLETCKKCANHKTDINGEIICIHTNKAPDFRESCIFFENKNKHESTFEEFEKELLVQSAGNGKRFANYIIDYIFMYLLIIVIALFGFIIADLTGIFAEDLYPQSTLEIYAYVFILSISYYTLIEFLTGGRSIGKFITKTKVITSDGQKPDFKTCLIRSLCRFIPFEAFSFFGSTDSGWHDSISNTRVVLNKQNP